MSQNTLGLNGASPQKQTRFAPIYTGRWSSGLWTNRSPLRDANTTRLTEKFYGPSGDALIAGSNVEITTRLTLARRPGNSVYDANSYTGVDRFYEFRMFGANAEQIDVMIDQAAALYALYAGTKSLVFTKSAGAGQTYMQSVGNTLYFGNGADNKKWLQSLTQWSSGASWNLANSPFFTTYLIDTNGNIQQLTGTVIPVTSIQITSNVLTVTSSATLTNVLSTGLEITFPASMAATFLENQTVTVTGVSGSTFTAAFTHANYGPTAESINASEITYGATPISGATTPTWSTTVPASGNSYAGGTTIDGTAQWTNRGNPVENWGIVNDAKAITPTVGSSRVAWNKNTFYSIASVVIDTNGNLQQVTTAGTSAAATPTWATSVSNTTTDGTVTWTMIQTAASLIWSAHHAYTAGSFLIGNAGGVNCLFQLAPFAQPFITGSVSAYLYNGPTSGPVGCFILTNPTTTGSAIANNTSLTSLSFTGTPLSSGATLAWATVNGAGETTATTTPFSQTQNYQLIILASISVPKAGQYTFSIQHHDGMIWGIGGGATLISGTNDNPIGQTVTANQGYTVMGGTNRGLGGGGQWNDAFTVNFPTAGTFPLEIDYSYWYHSGQDMIVKCNGSALANGTAISGATQPIWPSWSTAFAPNYPSVTEAAGRLQWTNIGPTADFAWVAKTGFTLPNTTIIDVNGYTEAPYRSGATGTAEPTFSTSLNALTSDNPNLIWINQGIAAAPPVGTVSTYNGGWKYSVALVNTLDDTVSNGSPLSAATGNFIGAAGVTIPAGAGLPPLAQIDPQADFVAIYRTTDGESTPFLIPGAFTEYTVPLSVYLTSGYTDTTDDEGLNNLIQAAIAGENTPPAAGAINLTYHLNRIFYSIGNIVKWTSGPDTPDGNGVNGSAPGNYDSFPSLVKRIVPTAAGALVFTVSDVYLIQGSGTTNNPIQNGIPIMQGVGLLSYNALDVNGSIVGFFTTDKQFCVLDPGAGTDYAAFPIGDQIRLNDGGVGTSWNPANVYVAWHVDGEDQGWYICDGATGWYRLMPTPAPEQGYTWSPFAGIVGGVKALQSVEVTPGVHKLLLGPISTGPILNRDLTTWADNGSTYSAWAALGSAVLAQPGQIAVVSFVTTESVRVGTPLFISVIFDEALPYYTGPWSTIKEWTPDPPGLAESQSFYAQRFYMAESDEGGAACRHMQLKVQWNEENAPNEIATLTLFGAYEQEA